MIRVFVFLCTLLLPVLLPEATAGLRRQGLSVLYVGYAPDKPMVEYSVFAYGAMKEELCAEDVKTRMPAFEKMLKSYFTEVKCVDARDYREEMSAKYDVTIFDALPQELEPERSLYSVSRNKTGSLGVRKYLSDKFDRPAILIVQNAPLIGEFFGLKLDWYCLCLKDYAYNLRTSHPVFKGPFKTCLTMEELATPASVYNYANGNALPPVLPMWKVQKEELKDYRIGQVAHGDGFEDSPDAEIIAGGKSLKSADAVAVGRHGNFLMWGFAASPDHMTEEAQKVFANTVCYISQFAGQHPIARKVNKGVTVRKNIRENLYILEDKAYETYCRRTKQMGKKAVNREGFIRQYLHKDLSARFGQDDKACRLFLQENMDYFYGSNYSFRVDEDVKSLGIPNNDVRLLEKCVDMLERNESTEKAMRILKRYTVNEFSTVAEWKKWLKKYRDKLFFTESCGYKFMVNDLSLLQEVKHYTGIPDMEKDELSRDKPVDFVTRLGNRAGNSGDIIVSGKIYDGFHIYASGGEDCPFIMTKVELTLPEGYQKTGGLKASTAIPMPGEESVKIYEGKVEFRQSYTGSSFELNPEAICKITYQCCDKDICMPPETVELRIEMDESGK